MFKRSISFILAILTIITVFSVLPVSAAQTNESESQQVSEEQVIAVGLWMMTENWKNTPIIYIRPHNMDLGSDEKERIFGDRGIAIAGSRVSSFLL